jgi:hypothetical protein
MNLTSRAALTSALIVLLPLTACSTGPSTDKVPPTSLAQSSDPAPGMDESLRDAALALIEAREAALVAGDADAFLATVDTDSGDFAETQARWFENLAQLPLADVSLGLGDEDVMTSIAGEGDYQLPVDFTMRLKGFDRHPVIRRMIYTVVARDGEVLLSNDRNIQIEARTDWLPAPWDVTAVHVRRSGGVMAVFDDETVDDADDVMAALAAAAEVVQGKLPRWRGRFVAYDTTELEAMDRMSSMELDDTAGIAFPVLSGEDRLVAYRFIVNPRHVEDPLARDMVFRHELVHVALAGTDGRSPAWLREGVAEYVARSVLPMDHRRLIAANQLVGIQPRVLDPSRRHYTRQPEISYPLSALACDYLASTRGEQVLWELMRTYRTADFSLWTETEAIARRELGMTTLELTVAALAWARAA